jgi:hypothetical protein
LSAVQGHLRYDELRARTDGPSGSSWGIFGDGDEYGTLNFLTPERVAAAARCIRRGAVFNLDYPLDAFPAPVRSRQTPRHSVYDLGPFGRSAQETDVLDDCLDNFYPQGSSHLDGLRHVRNVEHGFYGGAPRAELVPGESRLGIGRWAERGIAGRGVLIDVARYREGLGTPLDHLACEEIGPDLLRETLASQETELEPGDMVLLRTDCPAHLVRHAGDDASAIRTAGLAQTIATVAWLWDNEVALIAADNLAVEATPPLKTTEFGEGRAGRLHPQLIPLLGMAVGELWRLDGLAADCAADGVYEFFLVVKPLNLTGGVGSPANATAIK